jgi:hypothetical protein
MEKPYGIWATGKGFLIGLAGLVVGAVIGGLIAWRISESHPKIACLVFAVVTTSCILPSFFMDRSR